MTSLNEVENKPLWSSLLVKDRAVCSEENIAFYFEYIDGLDNSLIEFINRTDTELNFKNIDIEYELKDKLFRSIVICNDLLNNKYEELIYSLNIIYETSFDVANIAGDKFKILVDENIISMSIDSLNFIRVNYPEQLSYYIEKNIKAYVEFMTIDSFILDEAISILSWQVDDDLKIKLLGFVKTPLPIHGKQYPLPVNDYILGNNYKPDELLNLTSSYKTWGTSTQSLILSRAIQDISTLIANPNDVAEPLLKELFIAEGLNMHNKIALLIALLSGEELSKASCKEYLDLLGLSEFSKILGRGKPKIEVNETNQMLLTALKDNHFFSDFEEDDENPPYYKITKRGSMFGSDA